MDHKKDDSRKDGISVSISEETLVSFMSNQTKAREIEVELEKAKLQASLESQKLWAVQLDKYAQLGMQLLQQVAERNAEVRARYLHEREDLDEVLEGMRRDNRNIQDTLAEVSTVIENISDNQRRLSNAYDTLAEAAAVAELES